MRPMRAVVLTRRAHHLILVGLVALAVAVAGVVLAAPGAADPRLERAEEARDARQAELDTLLSRIEGLEVAVEDAEAELEALEAEEERERADAEAAAERVRAHVRGSYMHGRPDAVLALLIADDPATATEQARLLGAVAAHHQTDVERALATRTRLGATQERKEVVLADLEERRADLAEAKGEAESLLAQAEGKVEEVRDTIRREREEERRRREARRAAAARASRSSGGSGPSGDIACPVGRPRSFSDTWGQARSGGRAHKGTDILSPMGTPIYAYESGTISRMHTNRLGGTVLYLKGDSGTSYYYAHLRGYVSGLSTGKRVRAGEHIAFNGDSGNARGIPHLHIEVFPGGGGNVNPYPYMRRACG